MSLKTGHVEVREGAVGLCWEEENSTPDRSSYFDSAGVWCLLVPGLQGGGCGRGRVSEESWGGEAREKMGLGREGPWALKGGSHRGFEQRSGGTGWTGAEKEHRLPWGKRKEQSRVTPRFLV